MHTHTLACTLKHTETVILMTRVPRATTCKKTKSQDNHHTILTP